MEKNSSFLSLIKSSICWALILTLTLPAPFISAQSVSKVIEPSRPKDEVDRFLAEVARREAVVDRSLEDATIDPYRISPDKQWIEVIEKDGSIRTYSFAEINQNARRPKESYHLGRDIKVFQHGDLLRLEFAAVNNKPLQSGRVYAHIFRIPGIRSVLKDDQHIFLLLENGDILTIFMAHAFLFNPNQYAAGGALLNPFIDAVSSQWVDEDARLLPQIDIRFFDHIAYQRGEYTFPEDFDVARLRRTDILVLNDNKVVDVVRYSKVADALTWHIKGLDARFELMNGNKGPFLQMIDQASTGADLDSRELSLAAPEDRTLLGRSRSEFLGSGDQGLGRHHIPSSSSWSQVPWERRSFRSERLDKENSFVASAVSDAANSERGFATFDRRNPDVSPAEFNKTMEGQIEQYIAEHVEAPLEEGTNRWSRLVKSSRSLARYVGERAGLAIGLGALGAGAAAVSAGSADPNAILAEMATFAEFAYNGVLRLLPAEVANSKHFFSDFMAPVKAFDLPFIENEPTLGYGVKWGILSAVVTMGIALIPKFVLSRFDEKVLGEEMNKKGFVNGSFVGLAVYLTWTSRFCARLLQSQRSFWTRKVDSVVRMSGGPVYFLEDRLEANRMGISNKLYKKIGKGKLPSSTVLEIVQQASAISNRLSVEAMLRQMISSGMIEDPSKVQFSYNGLKAIVEDWINRENMDLNSEEVFDNLQKRSLLLNSRIFDLAIDTLAATGRLLTEKEVAEFSSGVVQDQILSSFANNNLWNSLNEVEATEVSNATKRREETIKLSSRSGNNNDFYKYRNGVVSDTIVRENTGFNFFIDMMTQYPLAWTAPSYSDLLSPELLVATDQSSVMLGLGSGYFAVEVGTNAVLWGAQVIPEQEVWAREMAGRLVSSYYQPELTSTESRLVQLLEKAHSASLSESANRYNKAYLTPAEWSHSLEKLTDSITIGELKGYRLMLTIVLPAIFMGYAIGSDWSYLFHPDNSLSDMTWGTLGHATDLANSAAKRLILVSVWAYTTYRIWWKSHYSGLKYSEGHLREDASRFKDVFFELIRTAWKFETAKSEVEKNIIREDLVKLTKRMDSFYEQNGKLSPTQYFEQSGQATLEAPGDDSHETTSNLVIKFVEHSAKNVPFPMAANQTHKALTTIGVGGITTVKGLIGFAFLWTVATDLNWWHVGAAAGGLYSTALLARMGMRGARAYFGYQKSFERLDRAITKYESRGTDNLGAREKLFKEILKTREMYRYFDRNIPSSVLDLEELHPDSDNLLDVAKTVRQFMLERPPVNPNAAGRQLMNSFIEGRKGCSKSLGNLGAN